MKRDEKAFIPITCPALAFDGDPPHKDGYVVAPETLLATIANADHETDEHGQPKYVALAWFLLHKEDSAHAKVISTLATEAELDAHPTLSEFETEDMERQLGQRYCERIKKCAGVIMRDGKPVCTALDPLAFAEVSATLTRRQDPSQT